MVVSGYVSVVADSGQRGSDHHRGDRGGAVAVHYLEGSLHPRRLALLWRHSFPSCVVSVACIDLKVYKHM